VKAVLFDLGGVLVEFDHRLTTRALAPHCRVDQEALFGLIFRSGLEEELDLGRIGLPEAAARLRAEAGFAGTDEELGAAWSRIFRPKEDSLALLRRLAAARVPMGIVSNTNELHFAEILRLVPDLPDFFRWTFLSCRLGTRKPERAYFETVASRLPFPASEALFVDDRHENVSAARAAGFPVHLFRGHDPLESELCSIRLIQASGGA
jgi:glucose-1-phosphatase